MSPPLWKVAFSIQGNALPRALRVSLPCALISFLIKFAERSEKAALGDFQAEWNITTAGFTTVSGLLGFLVVFRTSQAYSRYWEGCGLVQQMTGAFFDAASSVMAFATMSKADSGRVSEFRQMIVALTSLLNAVCFCELAGAYAASQLLLDIEALGWENFDRETQLAVQGATQKVPLVFYWWQSYVSAAIGQGVLNVPPPILSRTFAELGTGIICFENSCKLSYVPFPFHYSQVTVWLLLMHWLMTPLVVTDWTPRPSLAFLFSFVLIFVFWALLFISEELEEPFGEDDTDIDVVDLQRHANECLSLLLTPDARRIACFSDDRRGGQGEIVAAPATCLYQKAGDGLADADLPAPSSSERSLGEAGRVNFVRPGRMRAGSVQQHESSRSLLGSGSA